MKFFLCNFFSPEVFLIAVFNICHAQMKFFLLNPCNINVIKLNIKHGRQLVLVSKYLIYVLISNKQTVFSFEICSKAIK